MPTIRAVTLDCAGTLVRVDWQPERFAVDCAHQCGLELDRGHAESSYRRLLQGRWRHYQGHNLTRDETILDGFWREITRDWLADIGASTAWADAIFEQGLAGLYGEQSVAFSLFEDTLPALKLLRERGLRLAVLSNWDYSLHRVLRLLNLTSFFDVVVASLEEGVEKPDRGIFEIVRQRLEVEPEAILHVGDDPIDDVQGARGAGSHAVLIDRRGEETMPLRITDLRRIAEVIGWIA